MTILSIVIFVFVIFALSRVILRYRDKQISIYSLVFWAFIWGGILLFTIKPQLSEKISDFLGISKGTDALFFISIVILLYIVFRLYVKITQLDNHITDLTINISKIIHDIEKREQQKQ